MSNKYYLYLTARDLFKNKEQYAVDNLLSNHHIFDNFIHDLSGLGLDNATGGAFRSVFLGYYKDGVLLGSSHHSDNICYIQIASNPKSKWSLGCQESCAYGDPHPKLENGEWVTVWSYSDKKLKDGPWISKVKEVIQYIINQATEKSIQLLKEEENELEQKKLEKSKFEIELINNWT